MNEKGEMGVGELHICIKSLPTERPFFTCQT